MDNVLIVVDDLAAVKAFCIMFAVDNLDAVVAPARRGAVRGRLSALLRLRPEGSMVGLAEQRG